MQEKGGLPRELLLAVLGVAFLLYLLGAWTVVAVRSGQESAAPFVSIVSAPQPSQPAKPGTGSPTPKATGGQAVAPTPAAAASVPTATATATQTAIPPAKPAALTPTPAVPQPTATREAVIGIVVTPSPTAAQVAPTAAPASLVRQGTLGSFTVQLESASIATTLGGNKPTREGGRFLLVSLVVNNGERTRRLFGGTGVEYFGVPPEEQIGLVLADAGGYEFNAASLPQMMDPITQKQMTLAFDVPGDASGFQLVLREFPSKKEARIEIGTPPSETYTVPTIIPPSTATPTAVITTVPTVATATPTATLPPLLTGLPPTGAATPVPSGPLISSPLGPTSQ